MGRHRNLLLIDLGDRSVETRKSWRVIQGYSEGGACAGRVRLGLDGSDPHIAPELWQRPVRAGMLGTLALPTPVARSSPTERRFDLFRRRDRCCTGGCASPAPCRCPQVHDAPSAQSVRTVLRLNAHESSEGLQCLRGPIRCSGPPSGSRQRCLRQRQSLGASLRTRAAPPGTHHLGWSLGRDPAAEAAQVRHAVTGGFTAGVPLSVA